MLCQSCNGKRYITVANDVYPCEECGGLGHYKPKPVAKHIRATLKNIKKQHRSKPRSKRVQP